MQDMRPHLEKLRRDAAEAQLTCDLATDKQKRDLFGKLAAHYRVLADEVEKAVAAKEADGNRGQG